MTTNRVINVWAKDPDFSPLDGADPNVRTIIIGESPTNASADVTVVPSLPLFEADFGNLTHLCLWSTSGLASVPELASRQQVLEIRKSVDLVRIDSLPRSLQTLVIEDCPCLTQLPALGGQKYAKLIELSLAGCVRIDPAWINQIISLAPNLHTLDLSRCTQITQLPATLPGELQRLELNGCSGLLSLPDPLPLTLARLGLRGASSISSVPELRKNIDYVDLASASSLTKLPRFPELEKAQNEEPVASKPRTLFLFDSGIREPPASEHGATMDTNVALETREYQDEVDLVGEGTVRRCKLLLLGNGAAGKTKLALNLNPHCNKEAKEKGGDYDGTTHGVQFWDWPDFVAENSKKRRPVNLHMWDFGGQEIYHSTHRIFVSRGSVFFVLWNPNQDGQSAPVINDCPDVWYPVRYWLDYIHMECPHKCPLVAIVCSHQQEYWQPGNQAANEKRKQQLKSTLRLQIGDQYADRIPLFVLDSESDIGEHAAVENWLHESVLNVVETQGTVVPTYWEIAQNMVERWLPDPKRIHDAVAAGRNGVLAQHSRVTIAEFTDCLQTSITQELSTPDHGTDFTKLREHYQDGEFLTERRIQRALRFLTHSGWLYWNPTLFDSRVIIDQPWAMQKVYAALDRRPGTSIYKKLTANRGQFSFQNLQDWCWRGESMDDEDRQLILSFMTSVGVCFELAQRYSSKETTYISPAHLPDSGELTREFESNNPDKTQDTIESKQLHRGHWHAILRNLCRRYGDDGTYTKDACLVRGSTYRWNHEDHSWSALLRFCLDDERKGLGGTIVISVVGTELAEKLPSLKRFVESFLPGFDGKDSDVVDFDRQFHGCGEEAPIVFFSYAWDPEGRCGYYEAAVNAVYEALRPFEKQGRVKLLRDQCTMNTGDYITRFIQNAGSEKVSLVLVFSSDKYWKSWFCMAEFEAMIESLSEKGKSFQESVLLIEHPTGRLHTDEDLEPLEKFWEGSPPNFPLIFTQKKLSKVLFQKAFVDLLKNHAPTITSNAIGLRKAWTPEAAGEIITWVKRKLGLPTDGGEQ